MTLLTELQAMYDQTTKKLGLATGKLGSPGASLVKSTGSQILNFTGVQSPPAELSGSISFMGQGLDLGGDSPRMFFPPGKVTAVRCDIFQADTANPIFVIAVTLAADWKFNDSLPWLTATFWADLSVKPDSAFTAPPTLFITTGTVRPQSLGINLPEGISFSGTLDENKGLLHCAHWLLGSAPKALGSITLKDHGLPAITLALDIANAKDGFAGVFKDLQVPLTAALIDQPDIDGYVPGLWLSASLPWAGQSAAILKTVVPAAGRNVLELAVDGPLPLPSPDDLLRYFGGNSVTRYLPDQFAKIMESIHVGNIKLGIGLGSKKLEYASVTLSTQERSTLAIVPRWVEISDIYFTVTVFNPASQQFSTAYRLAGTLDIGGVNLLVAANLVPTSRRPDLSVIVQLDARDEINLTLLAAKFGLPAGAPEFVITDFQMGASVAGTYFIRAALAEHTVGPQQNGFILRNLIFELDYHDGQSNMLLEGIMEIAGVDADLLLMNESGWEFKALAGQKHPIKTGDLLTDLSSKFNVVAPAPIKNITLKNLTVLFNTQSHTFDFTCEGDFTVDSQPIAIMVTIAVTSEATASPTATARKYSACFGGQITIGQLVFKLVFNVMDKTAETFIATYSHNQDSGDINLHDLVATVSPDLASVIPIDIDVDLKNVTFVFLKDQQKKFAFGLDLGANVNLSTLPLIGDKLPAGSTVAVRDLQFIYSSAQFTHNQVSTINSLLPDKVVKFANSELPSGLNLAAIMLLGHETEHFSLSIPLARNKPLRQIAARPTIPTEVSDGNETGPEQQHPTVKWFNVQKIFGPISIEKIGIEYKEHMLYVLLNSTLQAGGLTIGLIGLGIGSAISKFTPTPTIDGIDVTFAGGPVKISGGLQGTIKPVDLTGELLIATANLTIAALGAYSIIEGHPSLFVYAVLDYPIGGPSFFFITGLAAGFGFNRKLLIPDLDGIPDFPLVKWAMGTGNPPGMDHGGDIGKQVNQALTTLATSGVVAPAIGADWLAVGVRFTSFQLVHSFVLLAVTFGTEFEINLLGLSTVSVPVGPSPAALAELELKAAFSPHTGLLAIGGQLSPKSFLLAPACHLTGGFAYYVWFTGEHAGDFVITLGGYSPRFNLPPHYPKVPRLGMNWQVTTELAIKGNLYFALTCNAVMAGGEMSAVWQSGDLRAWFTIHADFLMVFTPFHYYLAAGIDIGVSFNLNLLFTRIAMTLHLGVGLEIWGPEFTGKATVDLTVISFTINFGSSKPAAATTIGWTDFVQQLLPDKQNAPTKQPLNFRAKAVATDMPAPAVIHINVADGLIKSVSDKDGELNFIVCAEKLAIVTQSVIPTKVSKFSNGAKIAVKDSAYQYSNSIELAPATQQPQRDGHIIIPNTDFGVGPTGTSNDNLQSTHTITIKSIAASKFRAIRVLQNIPKALWEKKDFDRHGIPQNCDPLNDTTINDVLSGYRIIPAAADPDYTLPISLENLQYTVDENIRHFAWSQPSYQTTDSFSQEQVASTIMGQPAQNNRNQLLAMINKNNLSVATEVDVSGLADQASNYLLATPALRLLGEEKPAPA